MCTFQVTDRYNHTYIYIWHRFRFLYWTRTAPYSVLHRVEETVELSGYTIPKDTLIIPNLHRMHMDPRYWTDPERFNPDRWIGPDGSLLKHEAFVPFSLGELYDTVCLKMEHF